MTERINIEIKTRANRAHAALAVCFWSIVGIAACQYFEYSDYNWVAVVCGIFIGVIRLIVINNKFAWQIATIEEIRDIKKLLNSEDIDDNENEEQEKQLKEE